VWKKLAFEETAKVANLLPNDFSDGFDTAYKFDQSFF
jgi:hypothetical protein